MKHPLVGMISTAVLSLTLVAAAPVFAQEQHDQQEEQKAKPEENKAQPEKSAKPAEQPAAQEEKNAKPEEKNAKQEETSKPAEKNVQAQQRAGNIRWWSHSRRQIQGQFWRATLVSRNPIRLPQSPLPIRWLFVRIR